MQTASRVMQTLERARAERQRSEEETVEAPSSSRSPLVQGRRLHVSGSATSSTQQQQHHATMLQPSLQVPASEPLPRRRSPLKSPLKTLKPLPKPQRLFQSAAPARDGDVREGDTALDIVLKADPDAGDEVRLVRKAIASLLVRNGGIAAKHK